MKSWRINFVLFGFIVLGGVVLGRLIHLQVFKGDYYKAVAKGQQEIFESLSPSRGEIFFQEKNQPILAVTQRDNQFCYASPREIKDKENTADILAQILKLDRSILLKKLDNQKLFVAVKKSLTESEISDLKKNKLPGVYLREERKRFYLYNSVASDILGFVDGEGFGKYGIEGHFNDILGGEEITVQRKFNPFGYFLKESFLDENKNEIYLTIDKNIQNQAEILLEKAKKNFKIEGGQIIVVEPDSGKIIALADYPSFNPNEYQDFKIETFKNNAIQTLYEPGSIFKAITIAAAVNEKKITPETKYKDEGFVNVGGRIIRNYGQRTWGARTMTEVLEKSINTGAVFAQFQMGDSTFLKYIEKFGVFEKTGVELEGEIFSSNVNLKKGYKSNYATASFGQGIETTPLNFVRAFCSLANGGKLMRLYVVDEIKNAYQSNKTKSQVIASNILSQKTLGQITKMLLQVVEVGFGKKAKIPGYHIAGKTGTSQIPYASLGINKAGYSGETWQSFMGFFPAFEPKVVVFVKLDNPETKTAEYSAVPIFNDMARYIINYYQIPPDYE